MSFGRRASTIQEIQKRQRLQPVQVLISGLISSLDLVLMFATVELGTGMGKATERASWLHVQSSEMGQIRPEAGKSPLHIMFPRLLWLPLLTHS